MTSKEEIIAYLAEEFPQFTHTIEAVGNQSARLRLRIAHEHLRPGGTVSGPTMFGLADAALYVALMGEIGLVGLAVTTNMSINFLRKPVPNMDMIAEATLIKLGKTLAVGEVSLYSDGNDNLVAHAVGTYAIPPKKNG